MNSSDFKKIIIFDGNAMYDVRHAGMEALKKMMKILDMDEYAMVVNEETNEEKVVRVLKGDFEMQFGITFDRFTEMYHKMLQDCPERLI